MWILTSCVWFMKSANSSYESIKDVHPSVLFIPPVSENWDDSFGCFVVSAQSVQKEMCF